jgi:hypothetical protein
MNTQEIASAKSAVQSRGADIQVDAYNRGTATALAVVACPSGGTVLASFVNAPVFAMQFRGFAGLDVR